jgi:hypothetical protein
VSLSLPRIWKGLISWWKHRDLANTGCREWGKVYAVILPFNARAICFSDSYNRKVANLMAMYSVVSVRLIFNHQWSALKATA